MNILLCSKIIRKDMFIYQYCKPYFQLKNISMLKYKEVLIFKRLSGNFRMVK